MKGELTWNIEVLNKRLIEVNNQISQLLTKEAGNGKDNGDRKLDSCEQERNN